MPSPQIPNLNTFRGGGGESTRQRPHGTSDAAKNRIVQGTNNDASISRLSAVELGYLDDPFARVLTASNASLTRRLPIINRGTYVRTVAIDKLIYDFIHARDEPFPRKKQIISLGAGSDTRVFRLFSARPSIPLVYHELDFPVNTTAKVKAIRLTPLLRRTLQLESPEDLVISAEGDALHSPFYHIHPIDLRTLSMRGASPSSDRETLFKPPTLLGVDPTLPTLLISECCLIYLSPTDAAGVVDYFTTMLFPPTPNNNDIRTDLANSKGSDPTPVATPLGIIIYEPIRPDDPFGKTMVSNLATRGIQLQTLHKYASLDVQRQRFQDHGFIKGQGAADVDFIWERWVSQSEKERVASLEMLDEIEEWRLLAQHYCVAWGWREGGDGVQGVFDRWSDLESQQAT